MTKELREAAQRALDALLTCRPGDYTTGNVIHPSFDEKACAAAEEALEAALTATTTEAAATVPREKFDALLAKEHALSDAYVRVREILGAMDPPVGASAPRLWAYVESVAREKVAISTQPVQAQGEAVAEVCGSWNDDEGVQLIKRTANERLPVGAKLYTHPAPAVDRGLSEALTLEAWRAIRNARRWLTMGDTDAKTAITNALVELRNVKDDVSRFAASAPSQAEPQ